MIVPAIIVGLCLGAGLLLVWQGLAPTPLPLERRLARLSEPPVEGVGRWQARWQRAAERALGLTTGDRTRLYQDLALCDASIERHALAKASFAVAGAGLPILVALFWAATGVPVAPAMVLGCSLAAAIGGYLVPDHQLRRRAKARRRDFRYSLSLYLQLVTIVIAGGGGIETAVHAAANTGTGWAFADLRRTLNTARLERTSPWQALRDLGERIGSEELIELASAVQLAGTNGARVRESLQAKARSIRDHEHADTKATEIATSERMAVPMMAMFGGFLLLVGYPAMSQIISL